MMKTVATILSNISLLLLIYVVYKNNKAISTLNNDAVNINRYIKKGEVNDSYFFKTNKGIMSYLKSREGLQRELNTLKGEVEMNEKVNEEQEIKLKISEDSDKKHSDLIESIKNTYRSDMNHLVNLGYNEIQRHMPNETDKENLNLYRRYLYVYVLEMVKHYNKILPAFDLDKFINLYGSNIALFMSESIYKYKIFNHADDMPSIKLHYSTIAKELKDEKKLNLLMEIYFPRLFTFIEVHDSDELNTDLFKEYVLKETANFKIKSNMLRKLLYNDIPSFLLRCKRQISNENTFKNDIQTNLFLIKLDTCKSLSTFYKTWTEYNVIKSNESSILRETDKTKLLNSLITSNSVLNTIYTEKLVEYNKLVKEKQCTSLSILPVKHKRFFDQTEL